MKDGEFPLDLDSFEKLSELMNKNDFDEVESLSDFEKAKNIYNNAIKILNKACASLVSYNANIELVRCIGSNPVEPDEENTTKYQSDFLEKNLEGIANNVAYSTDENYIYDYERMASLGILSLWNGDWDPTIWLASRLVYEGEDTIHFAVRKLTVNGSLYDEMKVLGVNSSGIKYGGSGASLRPIIKLKTDVILSGEGTENSPYKFE